MPGDGVGGQEGNCRKRFQKFEGTSGGLAYAHYLARDGDDGFTGRYTGIYMLTKLLKSLNDYRSHL